MAQWNDVDLITASDDGVDVANQINNLRDAFHSTSEGTVRPTNAAKGLIWSKSVSGAVEVFMFTGTVDVLIGTVTTSDNTFRVNESAIATILDAGRGAQSGDVKAVARSTAPAGWLKCNGAAVSRTTYASLFANTGTAFGVGNGSTTFNLPDLRGEFVRGWDDARGVDSGRGFGSAQLDALQNITGHVGDILNVVASASGAFQFSGSGSAPFPTAGTGDYQRATFDASRVARTSTETRPRNVALLYVIKI